ncbi:MAG: HAD family hydrolase [Muribaculaceae bacterium]|nr:HAD family hydrolase [Muribaculaceae bacterium]
MKYDSLIFDMDGTLWDAVDSYVEVWNTTSRELGVDRLVTRDDLLRYMGKTIDVIYSALMDGVDIAPDVYLRRLDYNESLLMPRLGGRLYRGVTEGIRELASRYRLFMVSNCGQDGLRNMLKFCGLTDCFEGTLTHGETGRGKDYNIAAIVREYNLQAPLYIGDTQGDSDAAHAAGVDMCHVTWGFGSCRDAELSFDSFPAMTKALLEAKSNN